MFTTRLQTLKFDGDVGQLGQLLLQYNIRTF